MDSIDRPWSIHEPEPRFCEYCGDMFDAHHGLQRYCPEKFGRKDYCKYEQKKKINESKLADHAIQLAKIGIQVHEETPLEKNKTVLIAIMGHDRQKLVNSTLLDSLGYEITLFDSKAPINGTSKYLTHIGEFTLEWIGQEGTELIFKIIRK
jgi:hypothetical protein